MANQDTVRYAPKLVTLPIITAEDDDSYVCVGPWKMRKSYVDKSVVCSGWKARTTETPSLEEFLKKVDEDCAHIEKIAGVHQCGDTDSCVSSESSQEPESHQCSNVTAEDVEPLVSTPTFWGRCKAKWTRVVFLLALIGVVNVLGLATQIYLFAQVEGAKIILPAGAPSLATIGVLLALMAMSTGFVITFAWISVYSVSRGGQISCMRILANVMIALTAAVLLTFWTLYTVVPMLKQD